VTDVRDSSTGLPERRRPEAGSPGQHLAGDQADIEAPHGGDRGLPARQSTSGFPVRTPSARLIQPGGRHRRPVPASLPEGSPALILAVPSVSDDAPDDYAREITTILSLDNPALDVQPTKIVPGNSDAIKAALEDAAAKRPDALAAVVIPLLAGPHPAVIHALREAIAASGASACVSEVFNTNALLAEALHIRLADAGLARADRVRMFSITTSADGIIVATVGGPEAVGSASVTSVLLAARLALPVLPASLDSQPSIEQQAARIQEMGVTRIAIAPCVIGPEAGTGVIEEAASVIGAKCAAPLGAHGNVVKLIAQAYGMALSNMEPSPGEQPPEPADLTHSGNGKGVHTHPEPVPSGRMNS
jgi:sirohydrochlorin ferrochelatase